MTMERVHVWEETVTIPTYPAADPEKSPLFLENRAYQGSSGKVYPLTCHRKKYPTKRKMWHTMPFTWKTTI